MSSTTREPTGDDPAGPDFFDDDYLRILAPFHPEAEARGEVAALRELLGLAQDDRVLDLACGWGRHTRLLHAAGHAVIGADASLPLLRRARAPAETAGGGGPPGTPPPAVAADMRALPFVDRAFDLVLNLATSLGLFHGDAPAVTALAEARRVLRPGGRLVLEGMHRDDVVARYAARDEWTLDDGTRVRARRRFDALRGLSHEVLHWTGPAGRGRKRHSLRLRTATEVAALVERAGLGVREAWGDWDGSGFDRDAPRLILVAERL